MDTGQQTVKGVKDVLYYQVTTQGEIYPASAARLAPGIPAIGSILNPATGAYVADITARSQDGSTTVFLVEVSVETPPDNQRSTTDPLLRPADVQFTGTAYRERVDHTSDSPPKGITNSAGDLFDPAPEVVRYDEAVRVRKNLASVDTALYASYRGAVNTDSVTMTLPDGNLRTWAAGQLMVEQISANWTQQNGTWFWECTFELHSRLTGTGWNPEFLDQGWNKKGTGGCSPVPITAPNGAPLTQAQLLDGNGDVLPCGQNAVLMGPFNVQPQLPLMDILTF